jgi:hypothetical protein
MGNTLSLTSHATGTPTLSYLWSSSNTAVATVDGSGVVTPLFAGATNITYTVTDGSSTSCPATSAALPVAVHALPSGSLSVSGSTTLCEGTGTNITVSLSETGVNYQLRDALGNVNIGTPVSGNGGSIDLPTGDLPASTTFNVLATGATSLCPVQLSQTATVIVDPTSSGGTLSSDQSICGGSMPADLTLTGMTGSVVKWQKSLLSNFSSPTDIALTSTTLSSASIGALSTSTYFRAVVKSGTCGSVYSSSVLISTSGLVGDWLGTTSTDWNTASNWCSGIPTGTTDVNIPAGVTNMPVIGAAGAVCRNLTIAAGASLGTTASGTLFLGGNLLSHGILTMDPGTTLTLSGASAQSINGSATITLANLTLSNSNGATMRTNVTVDGQLRLTSGVLGLGTKTLTLSGSSPIRTSGSLDVSNASATLVLDNASAITLPASLFSGSINNMTISGAGGVTCAGDMTVNGVLNLPAANPSDTKGLLEMTSSYGSYPGATNSDYLSSNILTMGPLATTTGQGDVTGTVKRTTIVAGTAYTFGNQLTTVALTSGTMPTDLSVTITIGTAPAGKPDAIKRTYEIVPSGGSGSTLTANFHYLDSELNGNIETRMVTWDYDIPNTLAPLPDEHGRASYDFTNNYIGLANIPISYFINIPGHAWRTIFTMGKYAVGYYTWDGSSSSNWNVSTNWTPTGVPSEPSHVVIPDAATTPNDPILPSGVTLNTMTIENGGILTMGSQTLTIKNTLSGGWEDQNPLGNDPGTSKVIFSMPGTTISGNARFYDVEISNDADITNQAGSSMKIAHTITKTGTAKWYADVYGATINYNGAAQTVLLTDGTPNYHHLVLSGSGVKTMPASALSLHGNLTLSGTASVAPTYAISIVGNLLLGSGTTFTAGSLTHSVGGNFENNGATFTATGSTFIFNGAAVQSIAGTTASVFNNLEINRSGDISLGASQRVDGTLTLTSGKIDLGNYNLTLNTANAIAGSPSASNYIVYSASGRLIKNVPAIMGSAYLLPIGTSANYSPATFRLTGGSLSAASLEINLTQGKQPNIGSAPHYINRYWTLTPTGFTSPVFDASFTYLDADVAGSETAIMSANYSGSWTKYALTNAASNLLSVTGATTFSDFTGYSDLAVTPSTTSATICTGETVTIAANASGGTTPYSYAWTPSQGNVASFAASPAASTTYEVILTDAGGATTSGTVSVTVQALPETNMVVSGTATICYGSSTNIVVQSSAIGINYQLRNNADNALVGSAVAGTGGSITLTTGNLTATTTFNVLATNATTAWS